MEKDKLIVVYMDDERKGVEYAQLFTQKEFDNIFLISGGFDAFAQQFPELLEGKKAAFYQAKAKAAEKAKAKTPGRSKATSASSPSKKEVKKDAAKSAKREDEKEATVPKGQIDI